MSASVQDYHVNYVTQGKYAYCTTHGRVGRQGVTYQQAAEDVLAHNIEHHMAQVREKLVSKPGVMHTRVYRAVCDLCSWISDDWATPSTAAREARTHNGEKHRYWGNPRMKINEEKAPPMRDKKTLDTAIEVAETRLAALLHERAELDKLPEEPTTNGTIVRFGVQFGLRGPTYDYAAIRANGQWWLTGKEAGSRSWTELLEFMEQDYRVGSGDRRLGFELFLPLTGTSVKAAK